MIELDRIYNENCMDGMKRIPDGSVDCVICDLPYGVLNEGNESARWDERLPMDELWAEYLRVTKPNAAIILFAQGMFTAELMMSQPKLWRYNLVWKKGDRVSGFLNAKRMPLRNHEDICVFYRRQPTYHPQMEIGAPLHGRGRVRRQINRNYGDFTVNPGDEREGSTEKYPLSVLDFEKPFPPVHQTQKPVNLVRYLLRTYTNEGDTVLDNTIGSGTTAVAAVMENRHFIGFETDPEYYDLACSRVETERAQLRLF